MLPQTQRLPTASVHTKISRNIDAMASSSSLSALFGTRGVIEVAASQHGMTVVRMRRIRSKPSHEPVLGLFALQRTSDLPRPIPPTWNEPDLVLRTEQGAFTPEYAAIRLATGFQVPSSVYRTTVSKVRATHTETKKEKRGWEPAVALLNIIQT